jgi:hypothetical protein
LTTHKEPNRSSGGFSQIGYKHIKLLNEVAPQFMVELLNEEMNNSSVPHQWKKNICIPIYKGKLEHDNPSA